VTTPTEPTEATVPLSGATWTQGAEEIDQITGEVKVLIPNRVSPGPRCTTGPGEGQGSITAFVSLDGTRIGEAGIANLSGEGEVKTLVISFFSRAVSTEFLYLVFEPGHATPHTLSVSGEDQCGSAGGSSSAHFKIESVAIDVIGVR
jgi:hypothetical protein